MLYKFEFTNNDAVTIAFDVGETPPGSDMPIKEIEFEYNTVNTRRPKMEKVGSWPGFLYVREGLVHTTFDILAIDTDDFTTKKLALITALLPSPLTAPTVETIGALTIGLDGMTEDLIADCTIDGDVSIPNKLPFGLDCQLTWVIPQGYWLGATSGDPYYPK